MYFSIKYLFYLGFWDPKCFLSSKLSRSLYNLWKCLIIIFIFAFTALEIIHMLESVSKGIRYLTTVLYLNLLAVSSCLKVSNTIWNLQEIKLLIAKSYESRCYSRNYAEECAKNHAMSFMRHVRVSAIFLTIVVICLSIIIPMVHAREKHQLPRKLWYPFDITDDNYPILYLHQALSMFFGGLFLTFHDLMLFELCYFGSMQFDLLKLRLREFGRATGHDGQEKKIVDVAKHYGFLFNFINKINVIFKPVVSFQFVIAFISIAVSIDILTTKNLEIAEVLRIILFTSAMIEKIFFYCYFGNLVSVKSGEFSNCIYETDWANLWTGSRKMVLLFMLITSKPISMRGGYFVQLNLTSFINIMKASYYAYNTLRRLT